MTETDRTRIDGLLRRGQHGWPAAYPLAQFPNPPLLLAAGGFAVAAVTDGGAHDVARATAYAGLAAWAWLEVTGGVNAFRRVLGAAGFVVVIARVADGLGG